MDMAIVIGRATTTICHDSIHRQKLLVCQVLNVECQPAGDPMIVIDHLGAGKGDIVMISSDSGGVARMLNTKNSPVRWFTLGLVDPRKLKNKAATKA